MKQTIKTSLIATLFLTTTLFAINTELGDSTNNTFDTNSDGNILTNTSFNTINAFDMLEGRDNTITNGGRNDIYGDWNYLTNTWYSNVYGHDNYLTNVGYSEVYGHNNYAQNGSYINIDSNSYDNMTFGSNSTLINAQNTINLGFNSTIENASNSVSLGSNNYTNESDVINVGNANTNYYRRITNVGDPMNSYDAVNLNYLQTNYYSKTQLDTKFSTLDTTLSSIDLSDYYTRTQIDTLISSGSGGSGGSGVDTNYVDTQTQQVLTQSQNYTNSKFEESKNYTNQEVSKARKNLEGGVALAIALSNPLNFSNGQNAMAIGGGYYKGQSATSLSIGKQNENTTYQIGVAINTQKDMAFKASIGWNW